MAQHLHIPELDMTPETKANLFGVFAASRDQEYHYAKPGGDPIGVRLCVEYEPSSIVHWLISQVRYVRKGYFLRNSGVQRHTDAQRKAVISFELQNFENIPTKMFDTEGNQTDTIFYGSRAILWNTSVPHEVDPSVDERVFFQLDMERDFTFEQYVEKYKEGELLRW